MSNTKSILRPFLRIASNSASVTRVNASVKYLQELVFQEIASTLLPLFIRSLKVASNVKSPPTNVPFFR